MAGAVTRGGGRANSRSPLHRGGQPRLGYRSPTTRDCYVVPLIPLPKIQFYLNLYPSIYHYNPWIYCDFTAIYSNFEPGF
ncbi:MAG: hypothetical protein HLUCCO16_00015 [Phormidium sp. OSCR]|nr:MAG: hypothetical protein HLUCCO16_00015 [Phormidium sp. OSCR]